MTTETINEFQGQYRFLSNFYASEVELDSLTFPTVEHAYQAAKTDNLALRYDIQRCTKPGQAKRMGRGVPLVPHWDTRKFLVMHDLLEQKFAAYGDLADRLVDTGNALLVEGNTWHDNIWGDCRCDRVGYPLCEDRGANWLGRLLMVVREDLR